MFNVFAWVTFRFVVALTLGSRAPKINKVTLGNDMRLKQTTYDLCDYKVNSMQLHRNYLRLFDLLFKNKSILKCYTCICIWGLGKSY